MMAAPERSRLSRLVPRTRRQLATLAVIAVALVVALVLPWVVDEYYTLVFYQVLIYIALAQAWNLLAGYGGLVSLAPAASVGIGMYSAAVLANHFNLSVPFLMIGGGLVAAVFALLVSVPMFRFRGLYFAIATLVLGTGAGRVHGQLERPRRRRRPVPRDLRAERHGHLLLLARARGRRHRRSSTSCCARASG